MLLVHVSTEDDQQVCNYTLVPSGIGGDSVDYLYTGDMYDGYLICGISIRGYDVDEYVACHSLHDDYSFDECYDFLSGSGSDEVADVISGWSDDERDSARSAFGMSGMLDEVVEDVSICLERDVSFDLDALLAVSLLY